MARSPRSSSGHSKPRSGAGRSTPPLQTSGDTGRPQGPRGPGGKGMGSKGAGRPDGGHPSNPGRKTSERKSAEGWLFGRHPVEAALHNPQRQLHRLLGTREALDSLVPSLPANRQPQEILQVDRATLDDLLGPQALHQGLALKAGPLPEKTVDDLVALSADRETAAVLILDQVTDPHNVGAILRSAAAFGALAVIVQDRHSPEQTGVLAKAASGALERVPLVRVTNLVRALETLKAGGFWSAGLAADGAQTIRGAHLSGKIALCLGSEGDGLRRLTRDACDHLVRLPMVPGSMESLNVSNAAAVALYALCEDSLEESSKA